MGLSPFMLVFLVEILMGTEEDYSYLMYYWLEWREATGKEYVDTFEEYVELLNEAAEENSMSWNSKLEYEFIWWFVDFENAKEMWISKYTSDNYTTESFTTEIEELWNTMEGFYEKLHCYVRHKLKKQDEFEKRFEDDDLIPAHIVGNSILKQSYQG